MRFTVLVADDNEEDRVLLRRSLRNCPALEIIKEIECADELLAYFDGVGEYADRARHPLPDLLLLDGVMPTGDAVKVLECLKTHPHSDNMKIVVLSGSSIPGICEKALSLGAHDCYLKTADLARLDEIAKQIETHMLKGDYHRQMHAH
jgi:CheY-like chemotaxis protein